MRQFFGPRRRKQQNIAYLKRSLFSEVVRIKTNKMHISRVFRGYTKPQDRVEDNKLAKWCRGALLLSGTYVFDNNFHRKIIGKVTATCKG